MGLPRWSWNEVTDVNEFTKHQLTDELVTTSQELSRVSTLVDATPDPGAELIDEFKSIILKFEKLVNQFNGAVPIDDVELVENSVKFAKLIDANAGEDLSTFVTGLYAANLTKRKATFDEHVKPFNISVTNDSVKFDVVTDNGTRVLADLVVRPEVVIEPKLLKVIPTLFTTALSGCTSTTLDYDRFAGIVVKLTGVEPQPVTCDCGKPFKLMKNLAKHCATTGHDSFELAQLADEITGVEVQK